LFSYTSLTDQKELDMSPLKAPYNDSKERIAFELMSKIVETNCDTSPDVSPTAHVRDAAYWLDLYGQCLSTVRRSKKKSA
jgi:hypothetical protein